MTAQIDSPPPAEKWIREAFVAFKEPSFANERLIRRIRQGRTWLNLRDRIDIQTDWDRRQLERVARLKPAAPPRPSRWM